MERQVYGGLNPAVCRMLPLPAGRVLDLGCGDGSLGAWLKSQGTSWVTGVTVQSDEASQARTKLDQVLEADLDRWDPSGLEPFDGIVASHVLEHLADPWRLLRALRPVLRPGGWLLVALPNVLFWRQRLAFLGGRFQYAQGGLMDATHLRFFDWASARALLTDSGWQTDRAEADGGFPGSRFAGPLRPTLDRFACSILPGLLGFQFVFVARLCAKSRDAIVNHNK